MNKTRWLAFVPGAANATHLRELFKDTFALLRDDPEKQRLYLDRIEELLSKPLLNQKERDALEHLREDIEHEIEHGGMYRKAMGMKDPRPSLKLVIGKVPHNKKIDQALRMITEIKNEAERIEQILISIVEEDTDESAEV